MICKSKSLSSSVSHVNSPACATLCLVALIAFATECTLSSFSFISIISLPSCLCLCLCLCHLSLPLCIPFDMDKRRRKRGKANTSSVVSEEVSSIEWEAISMTVQEEDLIFRMYRLVGDRWDLIAGRIPGRKPEEIERFWIMRQREGGFVAGRRVVDS
ncbi:hypothetical protein Dimus_000175 [Dionaea muscipula]